MRRKTKEWIACTVVLLIVILVTAMMGLSYDNRALQFSQNCTEQNGVSVRDLEGKMRCVPTFAAVKGKP